MNDQFYINIVDSFPYAFLVLDEELRVKCCNRGCEALFSKTKNEIMDSELSEIIPHRELRIQAETVLQTRSGERLVELHLEADSPRVLRAIVTALNMTKQNGESLCLITLEDISERAQLEEQLVQSEKLAGMGLLASTIAHELGNPLSIISSTLQYIRDVILDVEGHKHKVEVQEDSIVESVDIIMDSIGRMYELLRTLSGFTISQQPHFEPTDLRRVLSQMLVFIHKEAEAHKVKIHHQIDNDLPTCLVNQREIKQLFLNLLKNALEAMPEGGSLGIRAYLPASKDAVCIDISDTGYGISENDLRLIFRPFYSTKSGGTGLGLSFCRRVVEEHGGEISVKSKLHKGSTFSVFLPVKQGGEYGSNE